MHPSAAECHPDACVSADQQFSRILRRWAADRYGYFDDSTSNHQRLRVAIEFLIGPLLKRSSDASLHEFWCDGLDLVDGTISESRYSFGGACIYSDRDCNAMWLAPFFLDIRYAISADIPSSVQLKLGHQGTAGERISKRYPTGRRAYRLYSLAHAIYGSRPSTDAGWAAAVDLEPYAIE